MPSVVGVLLVEADEPTGTKACRAAVGDGMAALCHRIATVGRKSDGSWTTAHCGHDDRCVREMSCDRLADWSSATTGYRSAYRSSYTHVYNQQKEVSQ